MSTTTPNMGLTKPAVGGDADVWGTQLNASLDLADAHDHTTGKGVRITTAALNINADLPFGGFGITGLKILRFNGVTDGTGYNGALFKKTSDNELYWRTNAGVDVKLTNGTSLNTTLVGGFTGDYAASGAQADYQSSTKIFNFLQAANHRAKIDAADLRLFEPTSGITNAVKLKSPTSLAASYDWIFPTALPGSTVLLQLSSAGQVSASNTVAGALLFGSTLGVTGLITATAGVTCAVDQHVTVSGTGKFKRGTRVRHIPAAGGTILSGTGTRDTFGEWIPNAVGDLFSFPVVVDDGERITTVSVLLRANTTGSMTAGLYRLRSTGDGNYTTTLIGSATTATNNNIELVTIGSLTEAVASTNRDAYVVIVSSTTAAGLKAYLAQVTTDVP